VSPSTFSQYEPVQTCPLCASTSSTALPRLDHLRTCTSCALIYVSPRPTQAAIAASYDDSEGIHAGWQKGASGRERLWAKRVERLRRHVTGGRALDVGAGFGDFLHHLELRGGWETFGTEVSAEAAAVARTRFGLLVLNGQVEDVSLSGAFDLITLWHVLEHLPQPGRSLDLVADLLAPGGVLALALPNDSAARLRYLTTRDALKRPVVRALGKPYRSGVQAFFRAPVPQTEIHLTHFSRATIVRALEARGLAVVETGVDDVSADPTRLTNGAFVLQSLVYRLTGVNPGEAMFVVARKPPAATSRAGSAPTPGR
jgi:SAM-dependent methyltransferase